MIDPRPRLQTLIFEVTQRCNHACLHCYNVWNGPRLGINLQAEHLKGAEALSWMGPQPASAGWDSVARQFISGRGGDHTSVYPRGELDTAQTLALLDKALDEVDCNHVTLTGGEPLLREDLGQILDLLCERNVRVTLISNGRLLDEPTVVDLLDRGVGLFELPLLGRRREVHDRLSGSPGAFDAALAAMAHIRTHWGRFVAVFVATRLNLPDLYETIKLAFAFGSRGMMLNRFNPGGRGRAYLKELLPSADEMNAALEIADAASKEFNFPISCSIAMPPCLTDHRRYPNLNFGFCAAGTERAYYTLDPLGNVRPCNHTPTVLGNLLKEPFTDIIAPERLAPFVEAMPAFCEPCVLCDTCQGGCKAAAEVCYGSLTAEEPFLHCNLVQAKPLAQWD